MNKLESVTRPLMWFMAFMLAALTAGCGGGGGGGAILGSPGLISMVSLAVTPAAISIPVTGTQQFTAIATFSDGSTQNVTATSTWTSATLAVATVVPTTGLATGLTVGTSVITATNGGKTGTAVLTVNTATPVSFKVTPTTATIPVGGTQQFAAIQTFSDGSTIDRTTTSAAGTASWTTSGLSAANATVGAATGLARGVTVTPVGTPVIVNASFTPVGGVALVATPATLIVNAATSVSFVVKPTPASIRVGDVQQFSAVETYSDGSVIDRTFDPLTAWTSVNVPAGGPAVATLSPNGATGGLATGVVVGSSTINAVYTPAGGVAHAATPANLTVTAATLVSVNVTPAAASIVIGSTQQFTATALYSDGSSTDVTANPGTVWTSVSPLVATITSPGGGLATGVAVGTSNIRAAFGGKTSPLFPAAGGVQLTVTAVNTGPAGALPNLKTASPFGVMAWDAMTINLGSHIYGDVALPGGVIASVVGTGGVNNGGVAPNLTSSAVTNSAGVTPGQINATNNGTLTLAQLNQLQADLNSVFTTDLMVRAAPLTALISIAAAANQPGGTFPAAAPDLSGYVLSPGVYTTTGTYGLSNALGPLVLDAKGNPNAVFIIRSTAVGPSGLTSTTGSVALQGGAQAKNVFWVVDNATIGASTFFQGTLVAGHVITLNGFAIVQGRMLAGALGLVSGAITLTGTNIITVPQ